MKVAERATLVAAVIAALSTLACCLPFGFLGVMGLAGVSVWAQTARPRLMGGALALAALGFVQLYRGGSQCRKRSPTSIALFWVAAAIVLQLQLPVEELALLLHRDRLVRVGRDDVSLGDAHRRLHTALGLRVGRHAGRHRQAVEA